MWTKRALVDKAFGELALAGYTYDITPEEQQDAASRLEAMVATWLAMPVPLPFAFSADPTSIDLDADSGVPMTSARTVYTGLAIDMAAGFGKQVHNSTRVAFSAGWSLLLRAAAFPPPVQLPSSLPAGAGNNRARMTRNPFMPAPDTGPLQITDSGGLNLGS